MQVTMSTMNHKAHDAFFVSRSDLRASVVSVVTLHLAMQ
jgi:hypothetical protein